MAKRGFREEKLQKYTEFDSSKFYQDEDFKVFKVLINRLKKKYHLSTTDVLNFIQEEVMIPCTIFTKKLSPLETTVKYLKENLNTDYSKIAELLGRDRKTVWQAHKNAVVSLPEQLKPSETEYNIPVSVLKTELSILEAVASYLKDQFKLSYHQIGELLQRNERTVWTVYSRAQKKIKNV
jgi:DNA-directed RNA polymerase specialized sigma24 family protein